MSRWQERWEEDDGNGHGITKSFVFVPRTNPTD
jgi:hypothetical protein